MYATLKHDVKAKISKEIWLRYIREGVSDALLQQLDVDRCKYETRKKVPKSIKSKSGE